MRLVTGLAPGSGRAAQRTRHHPAARDRRHTGRSHHEQHPPPNEPVIASYAHAPTRTVTAGGFT
ncbi:hypothetical protein [Streptomyces sp. NPDC047434]|uniref:hypothetical protein n=1 Tax=Streptomyces sp. NPDC047434 TaxID=3155143 RepID=UPI0033C9BAF4